MPGAPASGGTTTKAPSGQDWSTPRASASTQPWVSKVCITASDGARAIRREQNFKRAGANSMVGRHGKAPQGQASSTKAVRPADRTPSAARSWGAASALRPPDAKHSARGAAAVAAGAVVVAGAAVDEEDGVAAATLQTKDSRGKTSTPKRAASATEAARPKKSKSARSVASPGASSRALRGPAPAAPSGAASPPPAPPPLQPPAAPPSGRGAAARPDAAASTHASKSSRATW
mmetsp:Transcript_25603/g.67967  ORF Transcript_25603/g.67967 Transcript_25603/m.67967 type:complete len:233 (+) Transcript_25603:151-849(+)